MYNLMDEDKKSLTPLGVLWVWIIILIFVVSMFRVWINRPQTIRATECSLTVDGVTESWVSTRSSPSYSYVDEDGDPLPIGISRLVRVTYYYRNNITRMVSFDQMDRITCQPYISNS